MRPSRNVPPEVDLVDSGRMCLFPLALSPQVTMTRVWSRSIAGGRLKCNNLLLRCERVDPRLLLEFALHLLSGNQNCN